MEFIRRSDIPIFSNSGVTSEQLLFPENSASERVTVTRVTVAPGTRNPPHHHASSEQIWIALAGRGTLLLAEGERRMIEAGDVVRFADGDPHGFENTGNDPFVYISVTAPPINFREAYSRTWGARDN